MARLNFAFASAFGHCWLEYNATNGKASQFGATNTTGVSVYAAATLTNGQTFGSVLVPGENAFNLPGNAVTVSIDAAGEAVINGVVSVATRIPA